MPQTVEAPASPRSSILLWVVAVAFFMQMLDGTILNTALPGMAASLGVSPLRMQSVVISYMLTMALVIPASGWLADRFGSRRIFISAIIVFTVGSLLCALSRSLGMMVACRIVQGVGGALMVPVGRLAAIRAYPRSEMVRVLSFVTIPGLIGPLVGPTAGGFLVQYATWHWIFLINLPVGILGSLLAWRYMPAGDPPAGTSHFDLSGFLLFGFAMVLMMTGMEGAGELHLPGWQTGVIAALGLACLAAYLIHARRVKQPLFPTDILRVRSFAVGMLGNLFSRLGSGAMPFLMPMFLQLNLGFTPFKAGMTMIPSAIASFIGKSVVAGLVRRFGFRNILVTNTLALGAMIALYSRIDIHTSYPSLLLQIGVFGVVNSIQFTVMNTVTLVDLKDSQTAGGNSLLSVAMQISNSCGVALAGVLLAWFMGTRRGAATPESTAAAFHHTFILIGLISILTSAIFSRIPRDSGRKAAESARLKADNEA